MNILVFGGTRFFGKQLVERLASGGHDVTVATRGNIAVDFTGKVKQVKIDRTRRDDVFAIAREKFDVVYDNICYATQEAQYAVAAFKNHPVRYIYTSSLAVYRNKGRALQEEDFSPQQYEIVNGDREDFEYGEGKRLAEAVYFQKANFPVVSVRFPIVLDEDDYTGRLAFHVAQVNNGMAIGLSNLDAKIGFIRSDEAAHFLEWLGTQTDFTGPINAASEGTYSLRAFIEVIERVTGKEAHVETVTEDEDESPFDLENSYYLDQARAKNIGFSFLELTDWLEPLVKQVAAKSNLEKSEE